MDDSNREMLKQGFCLSLHFFGCGPDSVDRQVGEQEELQQLLRNQLEERQRLEEGRGVVVQHHVRDKEQQDKVLHLRGLLDGLLFSPDLEPYLGEAASSALQVCSSVFSIPGVSHVFLCGYMFPCPHGVLFALEVLPLFLL